jgi:Uma2 family endonuclease
MITTKRRYTAEDLWLMDPDAPYELVRGELVEVPPSPGVASEIAHWIGVFISLFVRPRSLGMVTGEGGGYKLDLDPERDTVVAPDIGFVRWEKLPGHTRPPGHVPVPPDLAVEVKSPSDTPGRIAAKLKVWTDAGVPLIWWVYPETKTVHVHRLGQPVEVLHMGDVLDGEDILPGFRLPIADIFS